MSYYSMYNYQPMPSMYGGYNSYHNPYMYGGGLYPTQQSYYFGGGGYGSFYPYSGSYYGQRSPGLFRNMYNRLRYGSSSYYYPEMGGSGRWPHDRDYSLTKWKRNGIY